LSTMYHSWQTHRVRRTPTDLVNSGFYRMAEGMKRTHCEPDSDTRVSFYKAFGWTPDTQRAIEQKLMQARDPQEIDDFPGAAPGVVASIVGVLDGTRPVNCADFSKQHNSQHD